MKKRSVLLSILLVLTVMFTACGSGNPFVGTWRGTLDVTKQFEDGIKTNYPELADYVEFEDLVFVLEIQFSEDNIKMTVDNDSIKDFSTKFEAGMEKMGKEALLAYLASVDMTLEETVAESGMTEDEYLEHIYRKMNIHEMSESMNSVTTKSLAELSSVRGSYTFNDDDIKLRYDDASFETIGYEFEGDSLILTIRGDGYSLRVECEQQ